MDQIFADVGHVAGTHAMVISRIIGASLSEPHTSGTALRSCVCVSIYACLRPNTVNFKCAFKYFLKVEHPSHGTSLLVCHSSYGPTQHQRQATHRRYKITCRVEITSGKDRA